MSTSGVVSWGRRLAVLGVGLQAAAFLLPGDRGGALAGGRGLMAVLGLVLIASGLVLAWGDAGERRSRFATASVAIALVALVLTAAWVARTHDEPAGASVDASAGAAAARATGDATAPATTPPASATAAALGLSGHDHHGVEVSIPQMDAATQAALDSQLATARQVALQYPHLHDALAAGFTEAAPYDTQIGSHYMKYDRIDHVFDVSAPEMLLYDGDTPDASIVGLTYYVIGSVPPEGFAGQADQWHQHKNTCITPDGPVFAGDGYRQCRANGSLAWMLHAWVVPGVESPLGVFSGENPRV